MASSLPWHLSTTNERDKAYQHNHSEFDDDIFSTRDSPASGDSCDSHHYESSDMKSNSTATTVTSHSSSGHQSHRSSSSKKQFKAKANHSSSLNSKQLERALQKVNYDAGELEQALKDLQHRGPKRTTDRSLRNSSRGRSVRSRSQSRHSVRSSSRKDNSSPSKSLRGVDPPVRDDSSLFRPPMLEDKATPTSSSGRTPSESPRRLRNSVSNRRSIRNRTRTLERSESWDDADTHRFRQQQQQLQQQIMQSAKQPLQQRAASDTFLLTESSSSAAHEFQHQPQTPRGKGHHERSLSAERGRGRKSPRTPSRGRQRPVPRTPQTSNSGRRIVSRTPSSEHAPSRARSREPRTPSGERRTPGGRHSKRKFRNNGRGGLGRGSQNNNNNNNKHNSSSNNNNKHNKKEELDEVIPLSKSLSKLNGEFHFGDNFSPDLVSASDDIISMVDVKEEDDINQQTTSASHHSNGSNNNTSNNSLGLDDLLRSRNSGHNHDSGTAATGISRASARRARSSSGERSTIRMVPVRCRSHSPGLRTPSTPKAVETDERLGKLSTISASFVLQYGSEARRNQILHRSCSGIGELGAHIGQLNLSFSKKDDNSKSDRSGSRSRSRNIISSSLHNSNTSLDLGDLQDATVEEKLIQTGIVTREQVAAMRAAGFKVVMDG